MNEELLRLALELCEIESLSYNETEVLQFICSWLSKNEFRVEKIPVDGDRFNIFAYLRPMTKFSVIYCTHVDTVAPHIAPTVDREKGILWGRGACDAKGIAAAMIFTVLRQRALGFFDLALLFTVGEEEASDGAKACQGALRARAKFLLVGEPTDLRAAHAQKGSVVFDLIARGKEAHSSMPHLGHSAVHDIIETTSRLLRYPWPQHAELGPSLINVGKISGGSMRNMLAADAEAHCTMRTACPYPQIRDDLRRLMGPDVTMKLISHTDPFHYFVPEGFETFIAAFGSDAPYLGGVGEDIILMGPGSIEVAHSSAEHIGLSALSEAVNAYQEVANIARAKKP